MERACKDWILCAVALTAVVQTAKSADKPTTAESSPATAVRALKNESGRDFPITEIHDSKGVVFAELYIAKDAKMWFNADGDPVGGAGFYQAVKDNYYYIPFSTGGFGGLHVGKVEWDEKGKLVAIRGLGPEFEGKTHIKITSDLNAPKIKDGILFLTLDGSAEKEFQFTIVFGQGTSIDPPLPSK